MVSNCIFLNVIPCLIKPKIQYGGSSVTYYQECLQFPQPLKCIGPQLCERLQGFW